MFDIKTYGEKYGWKVHGAVMREREWYFGLKLEVNHSEVGKWEAWITAGVGKFLLTVGKYNYAVIEEENSYD